MHVDVQPTTHTCTHRETGQFKPGEGIDIEKTPLASLHHCIDFNAGPNAVKVHAEDKNPDARWLQVRHV